MRQSPSPKQSQDVVINVKPFFGQAVIFGSIPAFTVDGLMKTAAIILEENVDSAEFQFAEKTWKFFNEACTDYVNILHKSPGWAGTENAKRNMRMAGELSRIWLMRKPATMLGDALVKGVVFLGDGQITFANEIRNDPKSLSFAPDMAFNGTPGSFFLFPSWQNYSIDGECTIISFNYAQAIQK